MRCGGRHPRGSSGGAEYHIPAKIAKDGDAEEAQFELAKAYLSGNGGVAKDSKQGAGVAGEGGGELDHPAAQQVLSYFCLNGGEQNIPKNPKQGLVWLRKSAHHGYSTAQYNLALLYHDGDAEAGVARNSHEAANWFRKAARQPGSTKSQSALDEMLKKGLIAKQEANWRSCRIGDRGGTRQELHRLLWPRSKPDSKAPSPTSEWLR